MSNRNLTILGVVTVLMVIWAVIQSRVSSRPRAGTELPSYLFPGLDTSDIGSIVIGTGEDAVTLKRRGGRFVIASKDDYPASVSKISEMIAKCLDIKTSELFTDEAAYHEDLRVTEANSIRVVKFLTPEPNSTLLAGLVIGKAKELGNATYVRLLSNDKASSDKVYLTLNVPMIGNRATDYVEQELVSINRDDVNSVTVSTPSGEYTLRAKEGSKDIVLENIPAGKKTKSSECDRVFTALANLRFDDIEKQSAGLNLDKRYVCRLKDSTVYTLEIVQEDSKTFVGCRAEYTGEVPDKDPTKVESEEVLKEKEAKQLAWRSAEDFTARHKGWLYEIADWIARDLTKELSELLEDEVKPEEVKPPAEPNSAGMMQLLDPNSVQ
jgi:hypothetical protein